MSSPLGAPAGGQVTYAPPASHGTGNIYWNKKRLRLPYPPKGHVEAVLSYWAPDGYFTEPNYCRNGGTFSATVHRTWGNPKAYMHAAYWFTAESAGPDRCAFTAVLNNTGSPPIAIIKLDLE